MNQKLIQFLLRRRILLSFLVVAAIFFTDWEKGIRPHSLWESTWGLAGTLFVIAGTLLRSWAAGIIRKKKSLATEGPYALTRHPLYLGSLMMAVGFLILLGVWLYLLILIGMALALYLPKVRSEEKTLAQFFGREWADYAQRVSIFFPKRFPRGLFVQWSWSQWLRNREYQTLLASLLALAGLEIWHE